MQILSVLELIFMFCVTLYLFHEYSAKSIPLSVKAICFMGWFLSFVIIILVPLDVYYTLQTDPDFGDTNPEPDSSNPNTSSSFQDMITGWRIVYWTNFTFTWFVLPVTREFLAAGDFTFKEKLKRAIKVNLRTYAVMAIFGVLFVVYLKLSGNVGDEGVGHFLMTFSNCFGLVLIIICLSYGLVSIPKRCLQHSNQELNLKIHQFELAVIDEQRQNLMFDMEELIQTIEGLLRRNDINAEDKVVLRNVLAEAPQHIVDDVRETIRASAAPSSASYANFTKDKLASLHSDMKTKINEFSKLETKWEVHLKNSFHLEDIIDSKSPAEWRMKQSYRPTSLRVCNRPCSSLEWLWYAHIAKYFYLVAGILAIGGSILVLFSEILNFNNLHIINVAGFIKSGGDTVIKSHFSCLVPLFYIFSCIYSALFNMRLAGFYGLYRHHHTDAPSLIFASLNFSRVSSPMVFNFLQMMKFENTAFQTLMGNVKFAYSFMAYFPLLLILLILCNIFDVYGRILNAFGLSRFRFNEESTKEKVEEGKKLLNKARVARSRSNSSSSSGTRDEKHEQNEEPIAALGGSPMKELMSKGYAINDKPYKGNRRPPIEL